MDYGKLIEAAVARDTPESLRDALDIVRELEEVGAVHVEGRGKRDYGTTVYDKENFERAHEYNRRIRAAANAMVRDGVDVDNTLDLYYKTHLFDAPHFFDSFCIYIERDRAPDKQFYLPRRKQLRRVAQGIQDLEDGRLHTLGVSLAPGVGKTTIAEFGLAWTSGRNPFLGNLIGSHNNSFLAGVYGEMLRIFDPLGEYKWGDVFPGLQVISTNAKDLMIGIGYDRSDDMRFKTLQCNGSLGSQLAGRVRAHNWLYLDDPVPGIEVAMNREQLDKLWQTVTDDFFQRGIGNRVKRLVIGTRWSLTDPIGRLEDYYADDPKARFIKEPALDENDESRFDYPYGLGYTTEALRRQREMMDEPSFLAIYQQTPIEREGQLYAPSELRRYFTLPDKDPDAILAICDTKEQGADYCVCPVFYQYGNDFYLDGIICDNGKVEVVQERVAQLLVSRKVRQCRIESNRGGTIFAQNIEKRVKELGGMTSITTKWTQSNKETRVQINSALVKEHVLFKDESLYDREYRDAMTQLTTYSMMGKNKHDDVPDALALFVDWQMSDTHNVVQILKRPF
jgi:predicted phage terminase large subunit-like protein